MPNYHRFKLEGGTYFFTVVTYHRQPILTIETTRSMLRIAWEQTKNQFPFKTIAICLLPDHLHCIWQLPEADADYSKRWNMIKGLFSKQYRKEVGVSSDRNLLQVKRREAAVWQRRFWEHTICDEDDLDAHLDYIHLNPVKHGYVEKPMNWKWSSFHRYLRNGFYDRDWIGGDIGKFETLDLE
jgi:putative transposase